VRTRARVLRLAGLAIGEGTVVASAFALIGGSDASGNLQIGADCYINEACVFDATALIRLGDGVSLGHGVLITTSSHEMGAMDRRAGLLQPRPVTVGDGAWIASRAVILPGVDIGSGAVVGAGAVVTRSVAPNTMVGGVPAVEIRRLDPVL
jgi:maltose O-acetyltransferase